MSPSRKRKRTRREANCSPPHISRLRTHTFSGCLTCRQRHVKCDLRQPSCKACERLQLSCLGYRRKFTWIPADFNDQGRRYFDEEDVRSPEGEVENDAEQMSRRLLFSDVERAAMIHQMNDECRSASSDMNLDKIFQELQNMADDSEFARIGPFGVLQLEKTGQCSVSAPHFPKLGVDIEMTLNSTVSTIDDALEASIYPLVWDQIEDLTPWEPFEEDASISIQALDLLPPRDFDISGHALNLEFQGQGKSYLVEESSLSQVIRVAPYSTDQERISGSNYDFTPHAGKPWEYPPLEAPYPTPRMSNISNGANLSKIPAEARMVLDYYSTSLVDIMAITAGQKSPWKTIHFPCTMNTLAELLVHGEARSLAKMSLFYAVLSVSSFHIGLSANDSVDRSQYWHDRGIYHQSQAEAFLKLALGENVSKSERGKYKEVLMSLLSMITIGVFSGNMQKSRMYLEQSEALIRICGLPKPRKSQKVTKLHHIFSYLRIIQESTSSTVYEVEDKAKEMYDPSVRDERNGPVSSSRLAWIEDDEPEYLQEDSLFVSIYQLPTTLLSLLAQTSSLCKHLRSNESSTPEFRRRCEIIEDRIFRWKAPSDLSMKDSGCVSCDDLEPGFLCTTNPSELPARLTAAMHSALIVHFQRQVRNTDPRILQTQVETTVDHLVIYEKVKKKLHEPGAAPPWPGFIVGCEVHGLPIRRKMETYFKLIRRYNVGNYEATERVIREVWRRQDLGWMDTRWESVLSDWNMQIVLT